MTPPASPLRYDSSVEAHEPDEARIAAELAATMRGIQETTYRDYGHAVRSVHAKSHALLQGELQVLNNLPPSLAQGLFARSGTYPVVLRLSTNPGDVLDDSVSAPRGLGLKVIGVEGERLPGSDGESTQDFVMANAPAFAAPDTAAFAKNLKLLAATTDTGQGWKKALSAALRGAEGVIEAVGVESVMLKTLGGQALTHPLGETFYSQTPFRYGDHVAKFSVAPVSPELKALNGAPLDVSDRPNALREAVIDFLRRNGATWEIRVQLRTNAETMPIEDASVPWPEEESPYRTVARITAPPQPAWNEARAREVDDALAFSPWHGLAAHRPLGSVNRARRNAYAAAANFRATRNGCPIHEPRADVALSRSPARVYGTAPGREGRRSSTPDAAPRSSRRGPASEGAIGHALAGAAGGLVAGLLLSALLSKPKATRGKPNELVRLQRRTAARAGLSQRPDGARPSGAEELSAHGGHLVLSALAGAAYGLTRRDGASPVVSGLAFGMGFYGLAYGVVAPALGIWPPPWRDKPSSLAQHVVMHGLFGVVTGVATDRIGRG